MTMPVKRLELEKTAFFVCDMQKRLEPLILGHAQTLSAARALVAAVVNHWRQPLLVTEQYPKAFQNTCAEVFEDLDDEKFEQNEDLCQLMCEKTDFSMVTDQTRNFVLAELKHNRGIEAIVLCGWEAHVCVQQTCFDLLSLGLTVCVVEDAVSSQRKRDRAVALRQMQSSGAMVLTLEAVLFELMRSKEHHFFKEIQKLDVAHAKRVEGLADKEMKASTKNNGTSTKTDSKGSNNAANGEAKDNKANGTASKAEMSSGVSGLLPEE
ncbi:unnamed protein product [Amoebophrya sp. A120]|nr:unnamed protein product [Amoebophrya sp. A120]|eukprot:GSA120T00024712001.1